MAELSKKNEKRPDSDDHNWKTVEDGKIMTRFLFPKYQVDQKMIFELTRYNQKTIKSDRFKDSSFDDKLAMIYLVRRKDKIVHVGYTYRTLYDFLRINLSRKLDKQPSIFDGIKGKLNGLQFEGVKYLANFTNVKINKEVELFSEKNLDVTPYKKHYKKIIKEIDYKNKFKPFTAFLYVHGNEETGEKVVTASVHHDDAEGALKYFLSQTKADPEIELKSEDFRLIDQQKIRTKTFVEMYLKMDELIIVHRAIDHGYNKKYRVVNENLVHEIDQVEALYLMINKDLLTRNFTDEREYPEGFLGFVYELQDPTGKKYIGLARKMTMVQAIKRLYSQVINPASKSKVKKMFLSYPFYSIKFRILAMQKKKNKKVNLKKVQEKYIKRYKTLDEDYGYNDEVAKNIRRFFAMKKSMKN